MANLDQQNWIERSKYSRGHSESIRSQYIFSSQSATLDSNSFLLMLSRNIICTADMVDPFG